ncbi:MAG TPA: 2,3-diphosphoglycerate-dependent phosphoglycerate mutase, partial [Anaeromyxobacteraceae bacterium]
GWVDVDLTTRGCDEARNGGRLLHAAGIKPDVLHTSLQVRAIRTAELALDELARKWIPVRRSWRLNERHYGSLQGLDKAQTTAQHGEAQVKIWRRSYDIPPPPLSPDSEYWPGRDRRYANLSPAELPRTECLKDTVERFLPYWESDIAPMLRQGQRVLIAAHGNSLRALVKHLEGISDEDIVELNIPTGAPLLYRLDDHLRPIEKGRYLGDPEEMKRRADAVASELKKKP